MKIYKKVDGFASIIAYGFEYLSDNPDMRKAEIQKIKDSIDTEIMISNTLSRSCGVDLGEDLSVMSDIDKTIRNLQYLKSEYNNEEFNDIADHYIKRIK